MIPVIDTNAYYSWVVLRRLGIGFPGANVVGQNIQIGKMGCGAPSRLVPVGIASRKPRKAIFSNVI